MTACLGAATIKNVVAAGKGTVPSAARRLTRSEASELGETAKALPDGWLVTVEAPYGQLSIAPGSTAKEGVGLWFADKRIGACRRRPWRPAL